MEFGAKEIISIIVLILGLIFIFCKGKTVGAVFGEQYDVNPTYELLIGIVLVIGACWFIKTKTSLLSSI